MQNVREQLAAAEQAHADYNKELEQQKETAEAEVRRLEIERQQRMHRISSLEETLARLSTEAAFELGDEAGQRKSTVSNTIEAVERAEERLLEAQSQLTSAEGERDEKLEEL